MLGLRKDPHLAYTKRWAAPLAAGWLLANDIRHVVVVDAPDYSLDARTELAAWFGGLGVRVWFTWTDPTSPDPAPSSVCADAVRVEAEEFWATFPDKVTRAATDPPAGALPRLPRVDGTVFRSACRDLLDPEAFAAVDEQFRELVAELRPKVRAHARPTNKYDLRLLRRLIDHAPDTEELLLRVRAAQVAYLLEGRHVVVNTTALLGAAEALPRRGFSVSQQWWDRLEAYWDPDVPAAVALHHAEVTVDELCSLTLADVKLKTPDEVVVSVGREDEPLVAHIDGPPARFVTALVVFRLVSGAGPDERLFVTHRAGHIARKFAADRLMRDPETEVGVWVRHRLDRRQTSDGFWLHRYGVGLTKLFKERNR